VPKKSSKRTTRVKHSTAAKLGHARRKAAEAKRSAAALKGWETRRKNEQKQAKKIGRKKSQSTVQTDKKRSVVRSQLARVSNREYLIFIFSLEKGVRYFSDKKPGRWNPVTEAKPETERKVKGVHSSSPRILVVFDDGASDRAVIAFAIYRIERDFSEDWQWVRFMLQGGNRRVEVAAGELTSAPKGVKIGRA